MRRDSALLFFSPPRFLLFFCVYFSPLIFIAMIGTLRGLLFFLLPPFVRFLSPISISALERQRIIDALDSAPELISVSLVGFGWLARIASAM